MILHIQITFCDIIDFVQDHCLAHTAYFAPIELDNQFFPGSKLLAGGGIDIGGLPVETIVRDSLVRRQVYCDVNKAIILVVKGHHCGIQGIRGPRVVAKVGINVSIQTPGQ